MRLAVVADEPVGANQHGGIVQLRAIALRHAGDQINIVLSGEVHPNLNAGAVWHLFGMVERLLPVGKQVSGIGQFGQYNQIRPRSSSLLRQPQPVSQVAFAVLRAHLRIELNDGDPHRTDTRFVIFVHSLFPGCSCHHHQPKRLG